MTDPRDEYAGLDGALPLLGRERAEFEQLLGALAAARNQLAAARKRKPPPVQFAGERYPVTTATVRELLAERAKTAREMYELRRDLQRVVAANVALVKAERLYKQDDPG